MKDYLSILAELPAKHSGLIFEQIHRAALVASGFLRRHGLALPGETKIPTYQEVKDHLAQMVNRALDGYYGTQQIAPQGVVSNEIWGEDGDGLFSVVVTGLGADVAEGLTAEIDMNLLYNGEPE